MPDMVIRTEYEAFGARHVVETHLDPVFSDEGDAARADFLDRHKAALTVLAEWVDKSPAVTHACPRCGDVHLPAVESEETGA